MLKLTASAAALLPPAMAPHLHCLAFVAPFLAPPVHPTSRGAPRCPLRSPRLAPARTHPRAPRRPFAVSAAAAQDFVKKDPSADPDRHDIDSSFNSTSFYEPPPTPFSGAIARTSLQALIAYYRDLCREQPFIAHRLAAAIAAIAAAKIIGVTVPFFFKRLIDNLMSHAASTDSLSPSARRAVLRLIAPTILLHALARVFASVAHELRNSIFAKAGQRIGRSITATSFAHIHSLEAAFHNSSQTGAVTRVVDRGTRSVLTIFRSMLFAFLPTVFELLLICAVLVTRFSSLYVLITLVTFAVFIAWTLAINDELGKVRAQMNAVENEASAKLTDSLMNVEAVKAFDNASFELQRYDESLRRYESTAVKNEWLYARLNMGQGIIFTVGLTCNLFLAANGVLAGTLTVGSVVMLATMLQQLWVPLNFLGWQYRELKQSLIDLQNLFDMLRRDPKIFDVPDAKPLKISGGEIVFDNVSFTYSEPDDSLPFTRKSQWRPISLRAESSGQPQTSKRKLALDSLSFRVPAGKSLALVGSSGSGKSTATRLLYRLYDVSGGRILIDGQDISKATLSSLRQAVSIVPQDTALFNDTIAYNIRYGRPSASDEEVIAAAKAASIHDVITRTAQGYQTVVGERGVRLSGGERQRLSVARAFLKGSTIILEDESTSALDTLTELEVSKALQKLSLNRTRIIVAHRLSTIMNVDHIVVMKLGKVVEEGSFAELLQIPNGIFKNMWERQQKKDNDREPQGQVENSGRDFDAFEVDNRDTRNFDPGSESILLGGIS